MTPLWYRWRRLSLVILFIACCVVFVALASGAYCRSPGQAVGVGESLELPQGFGPWEQNLQGEVSPEDNSPLQMALRLECEAGPGAFLGREGQAEYVGETEALCGAFRGLPWPRCQSASMAAEPLALLITEHVRLQN